MRVNTKMKRRFSSGQRLAPWLGLSLACGLCIALSGCANFAIKTPAEMVEVTSKYDKTFDYRATTMEGAVVGVRVLDEPAGEGVASPGQSFWVEAIKRDLRLHKGYALLEESQIKSANGHTGTLLKFGRDQRSESYTYWIAVFRTDKNLHLVDAGGRADHFEQASSAIEKAIASYEVNP